MSPWPVNKFAAQATGISVESGDFLFRKCLVELGVMETKLVLAQPFVQAYIGVVPVDDFSFSAFGGFTGGTRVAMFSSVNNGEAKRSP